MHVFGDTLYKNCGQVNGKYVSVCSTPSWIQYGVGFFPTTVLNGLVPDNACSFLLQYGKNKIRMCHVLYNSYRTVPNQSELLLEQTIHNMVTRIWITILTISATVCFCFSLVAIVSRNPKPVVVIKLDNSNELRFFYYC